MNSLTFLQLSAQADTTYIERLTNLQASVDSILDKITPTDIIKVPHIDTSSETTTWISIISVVIALSAAVFGFMGYWSQRKTTMNTSKVSISVQKAQFINITRHLYRNLICTIALYERYTKELTDRKERNDTKRFYPSEEHLLKLKFEPEDVVHWEKYLNSEKIFALMNQFKFLVRNYDIEVDLTLEHIKSGKIADATINSDFKTLMFKPFLLISKMIEIESLIDATDKKYSNQDKEFLIHRAAAIFLDSHIDTVHKSINSADWNTIEIKGYAQDKLHDCSRSFKNLFKDNMTMELSDIMDSYDWPNEDNLNKYVSEHSDLERYFNALSGTKLHKILRNSTIDFAELLSIAISVDSSLEKKNVVFVNLKN